jgi:hypothetical protein
MSLVYATPDDYRQYLQMADDAAAPANLGVLLQAASLAVREYTSVTVYKIDPSGMPTDPLILTAFRDATCAHAATLDALGIDPNMGGVTAQSVVASKSISGASVTYSGTEQTRITQLRGQIAQGMLAPTAKSILDLAGLNMTGPWAAG